MHCKSAKMFIMGFLESWVCGELQLYYKKPYLLTFWRMYCLVYFPINRGDAMNPETQSKKLCEWVVFAQLFISAVKFISTYP